MHGRLKVRTSAEEAVLKKKEQELKVKAYRAGMKKIYQKRDINELDDEMIQITGEILSKNPDVYTLWNIRRECLLEKRKQLDDKKLQSLFDRDLSFTEQCLMINPKSYGPWHHRCWIMENCPIPNWEREIMLCTQYLNLDERNFHCWDYRRFVVDKAKIALEKELEFCTQKIRKNFSNYSSWHYRSKLLPILYPHVNDKFFINEEKLKYELEMVLTAAFTDPNDSSAWFYQRWLLGYSQPALDIAAIRISSNIVVISFTKHINLQNYQIKINYDLPVNSMHKWKPANEGNTYDVTWVLKGEFDLLAIKNSPIVTCLSDKNDVFQLGLHETSSKDYCGFRCPKFEYEFGAGVIEELKNQLHSCNQLLEFEPDSKWTLLTAALLMRAIDRKLYHEKALEYLKKLEKLDSLRKSYYEDLASKWNIEKCIEEWFNNSQFPQKISLSSKNLTTICYEQYLSIATEIVLSKNLLTNRIIPKLKAFQYCEILDLSDNKIIPVENDSILSIFKGLNI